MAAVVSAGRGVRKFPLYCSQSQLIGCERMVTHWAASQWLFFTRTQQLWRTRRGVGLH